MAFAKKETTPEIHITALRTGTAAFCMLGRTPLIFHAMSLKAQQELLMPRGTMTRAEKATNLKHNPIEEYRNSVYAFSDDDKPTRLLFPCGAFKKAIANAALVMPGVAKSEIGRLAWIEQKDVAVYGVPELYMAVVRNSGIQKTPDIRTRAILPQWACRFEISYVEPHLNAQSLANLLSAAGLVIGIGDGRQEKGAFAFGQFEIVSEDDERYQHVIKTGGRAAQDAALTDPACHDLETERMYGWFNEEISRRGRAAMLQPEKKAKGKKKAAEAFAPPSALNGNGGEVHQ